MQGRAELELQQLYGTSSFRYFPSLILLEEKKEKGKKDLDFVPTTLGVEQRIDFSGIPNNNVRINVPALYQLSYLALCWRCP